MAGLVSAMNDLQSMTKTWMPGTRPGMTVDRWCLKLKPASGVEVALEPERRGAGEAQHHRLAARG